MDKWLSSDLCNDVRNRLDPVIERPVASKEFQTVTHDVFCYSCVFVVVVYDSGRLQTTALKPRQVELLSIPTKPSDNPFVFGGHG